MAKINNTTSERIFTIRNWGGLHECPDGDTEIKLGEAAEMRNFCVTRDGNLQLRPGTKTIFQFEGAIRGIWNGYIGGVEYTVCAADGSVWTLDFTTKTKTEIGVIEDVPTFFFGFSEKLYIMNGLEYMVWDGDNSVIDVFGYRPLTQITVAPTGGGTSYEQVNKLNGTRRCWLSPDGTATVFHLPETNISSVDYVKIRSTKEILSTGYSVDTAAGTITFTNAPANGTNTYEIGWTYPINYREQVLAMRFSEIFNGTTDNRVFIYGDGSNKAFYSGLDYDGFPTAEYFPDLNVLDVGSENTPITALIRHYSKLVAFKTDSTYTVRYGQTTLDDKSLTAAFYTTPVNRIIGNEAYGQVQLVLNNPYSLQGSSIYMWKNSSSYSSNITTDERQAKVISQNVFSTLKDFNFSSSYAYDDNFNQEYYLIYNGTAIIQNYALNVWYKYTNFPFTSMISVDEELYGGTADGKIMHISRNYLNDNGNAIDAYWRSGSLAFDRDWQRKNSSKIYITMRPEAGGKITITIKTNRKSDYIEKVVSYNLATFKHTNFAHFSFNTNRQPQVERLKIKAKKFAYYQLIFSSNSTVNTATILTADIKVRYTGDVK